MPQRLFSQVLTLAATLFVAGAFTAPAHAVFYNETTDGDLNGANVLTKFTLDPGLNHIFGGVSFATTGPSQYAIDFDSFAFVVPEGYQVSSVYINGQHANSANATWKARWELYAGSADPFNGTNLSLTEISFGLGVRNSVDVSPMPLLPGLYNFSQIGLSGGFNDTAYYEFGLNLTLIPEPATLTLLAAGSPLLLRRRRV